jgi:[acyl-carrier-protein] S-malonyltransferase
MGRAFHDSHESVKRLFDEASDLTGMNLRSLCFEDPDRTLVRTDNVQPAITLVNIACLQVLREDGIEPAAVAGHSLGEYAALYAAGVLSFADTMRLVRVRGTAMKEAAERHPGGMVAIFGLDPEAAEAVCAAVTTSGVGSIEVANQNSPQQIALTGESEALKAVSQLAKQRGAKLVVPLKVSGAWHSRFMGEAQDAMLAALERTDVRPPSIPVVANLTAEEYPNEPHAIRQLLIEQLVRPVLWVKSIRRLIDSGHRVFLETGPGKVLTGLMRDTNRDVSAMNVQDMDTLGKLRDARSELLA